MKIARNLFVAGLCLLIALACNKEKSLNSQSVANLEAAKKSLQTGQPITIQLNNVPSGARLAWSVTPPQHASVQAGDQKATIVFNAPGSYTITAAWLQATDSIPVFCDTVIVGDTTGGGPGPGDTTYHPGLCDTVINGDTIRIPCDSIRPPRDTTNYNYSMFPVANDQLQITPVLRDTGIVFIGRTVNVYNCLNSYISGSASINDSLIYLSYNAVMVPPPVYCSPGQRTVTQSYMSNRLASDGTIPIHIVTGTVVYIGTVTVSNQGTKYTFNWPYTSGVTFTTTVVQR